MYHLFLHKDSLVQSILGDGKRIEVDIPLRILRISLRRLEIRLKSNLTVAGQKMCFYYRVVVCCSTNREFPTLQLRNNSHKGPVNLLESYRLYHASRKISVFWNGLICAVHSTSSGVIFANDGVAIS